MVDQAQLKLYDDRFKKLSDTIAELEKQKAIQQDRKQTLEVELQGVTTELNTHGFQSIEVAEAETKKLETEFIAESMRLEKETSTLKVKVYGA